MNESNKPRDELRQLARAAHTGLVAEYWHFLKHHKKWWLLPILAVLLLVAGLVFLGGTAAAPFIYALF